MQHLDTDRLAALADESPTAAETEHLAACATCRGERDAYVALLDLAHREGTLGRTGEMPIPLTNWDSLSAALRAEGLLTSAPVTAGGTATTVTPLRVRTTLVTSAFLRRAAASVALLVGGAAVGRATATPGGLSLANRQVPTELAATKPASATAPAASPSGTGISRDIPVYGEQSAHPASNPNGTGADFSNVADAMNVLSRAQHDYQRAAAFLAEHDSGTVAGSPQILQARLAALDEVMPKVRAALSEAPQDPVLNQYYMATYDVRESTLRQLGRALPVGMRLNGY